MGAIVLLLGLAAGVETEAAARELEARLLAAPFPVPRDSFFFTALDVPPLEPGWTLPCGEWVLRLATSQAHSDHSESHDGVKDTFQATIHEWLAPEIAVGATDWLEIAGRTVLAGWDEEQDRFEILDEAGAPIVRDEDQTVYDLGASGRHMNMSDLVLRGKALVHEEEGTQIALALSVKLPWGRQRDLTNAGTYDVNARALGTFALGNDLTLHVNFGAGAPFGSQDLFVRSADVDLDPWVQGGAALNLRLGDGWSAGAQVEANTSAFRDVEFLEDPVLTGFAGVRKDFGGWFLEGGFGAGLLRESSYSWTFFLSAVIPL